jgi:hypothetical protein
MTPVKSGADDKLDNILVIVNDIKTDIAVFVKRVDDLESTAKENKTAIKGNGKPGLESRMALVEVNLKTINWVGAAIVVAIIGDIMTRILK